MASPEVTNTITMSRVARDAKHAVFTLAKIPCPKSSKIGAQKISRKIFCSDQLF